MSALHDQLHEFSRDQYKLENERMDKLLDRIGLISVVLVVVGNIVAAFISVIPIPFRFEYTHLLFYLPFATGIILAALSFVRTFAGLMPRKYQHPSVSKVNERVAKSKAEGMKDEDIELGLKVLLIEMYSGCASDNAKLNARRREHVYWGLRFALIAVGSLILSYPGYLKMKSDLPDKTTNVK